MTSNCYQSAIRAVLLGAACLMSGCAGFQGAPEWSEEQNLTNDDALYGASVTKFYARGANRKDVRNEFIEVRTGLIDRNYAAFKRSLHTERVGAAVGVDWSTLILGSIAAAASKVDVKTGAGALVAILAGGKSSVDKNLYFDRALPAMLSLMDARRAEIRDQILTGMQLDEATYSLLHAKADLHDYFDAGTITGAITQITSDAANRQKAAEGKLKQRTQDELVKKFSDEGYTVHTASTSRTTTLFNLCFDKKKTLSPAVVPVVHGLLKKYGLAAPRTIDEKHLAWLEKFEPLRADLFSDPDTVRLFMSCTSS